MNEKMSYYDTTELDECVESLTVFAKLLKEREVTKIQRLAVDIMIEGQKKVSKSFQKNWHAKPIEEVK